jgi:hypothetical protein
MGNIQKTDKSNAKNVDAINYKMGSILDWTTLAE